MRIDTALFSRNCGRGPGRLHPGRWRERLEEREAGRGRERWRETPREARREMETDWGDGRGMGRGWEMQREVQREGLGASRRRESGESHGDKEVERERQAGHFPGGPVAKTPGSHCRACGLDSWSGN